MKKVLFISSTGGHLNELMQLSPLFEKYDYNIITEKDKTNEYLEEKYGKKVHYLPYGTRSHLLKYIFIYLYLILKTIYLYIKIRPQAIVTTGTHTAGPMCYLGKIFGSKIIYIETFANINRKTATGKLIYPIADLFIVQWEEMLKLYPKAKYVGQSYGVFCVSLSEEDKEQIYLEYELLLEKRRQEEDERLQRAKEAQLARSHTKAKKRFSSGK